MRLLEQSMDNNNIEFLNRYRRSRGIEEIKPQEAFYEKPEESSAFLEKSRERRKGILPNKKEETTEFPFEGENDLEREIERSQARTTSRIGETILGATGDLINFIANLVGENPIINLPGQQDFQNVSEKVTLGYTKPQTEFENKTDELAKDVGSLLIPGGASYGVWRNLGIPIVANLAKEGIKAKGGEGKTAQYAKAGIMLGLDLLGGRLNQGSAKNYAGRLMNEAEALVPQGASINSRPLMNELNTLERQLTSGGTNDPTAAKALSEIKELRKMSVANHIPVKRLIDARKTMNKIIEDMGGFEYFFKPKIKSQIISKLNQVKNKTVDAVTDWGRRSGNSQFIDKWHNGNEAFSVAARSEVVGNFLEKNIGSFSKAPLVKGLFGLGGAGAGIHHLASGASKLGISAATIGASAAIPIYEGAKIIYQVAKSPNLRKYYMNIINAASYGNLDQVTRNANALEKELQKEKSKNRKIAEEIIKD